VDVVPVDPAPWKHGDPFSGAYEDGRVYGRGSVDMKGGIASGMLVLDALLEHKIALKGDLQMQFVADEENGGNGDDPSKAHQDLGCYLGESDHPGDLHHMGEGEDRVREDLEGDGEDGERKEGPREEEHGGDEEEGR
jgi:hypothetical protein